MIVVPVFWWEIGQGVLVVLCGNDIIIDVIRNPLAATGATTAVGLTVHNVHKD